MVDDPAVDIHLQDRLGIHLGKGSQALDFPFGPLALGDVPYYQGGYYP